MGKLGASVPFRATNPRVFWHQRILRCRMARVNETASNSATTAKSSTYESQGSHFGGRPGNAALSADPGNLEAIAANLRQAANLLFADHADAGRHPRDFDHHDTGRDRAIPAPARRRKGMGNRAVLYDPGSPRWNCRSLPDWQGVSRCQPVGADP